MAIADEAARPGWHDRHAWLTGAAVALVCLALGVVSAMESHHVSVTHGDHVGLHVLLGSTMPRWIVLAGTLPFVLVYAVRTPLRPVRAPVLATHALAFLTISLLHAYVIAVSMELISPFAVFFPWSARILRAWYGGLAVVVSTYGCVLAAAWGMHEAREREHRATRASQLEAQLQSARLAALRAKLQPHFLYNTLHAIAALVQDVRTPQAMVAIDHLSELLHASLRDDEREHVAVRDELDLATRYLALQQMRFGDRLVYDVDLEPAAANATVPVLLLQPLVENAVLHGLDAGTARLHVSLRGVVDAHGDLRLSVENDGVATAADRTSGHGLGIAATRARLATRYGERARLELAARAGGGMRVDLLIPQGDS